MPERQSELEEMTSATSERGPGSVIPEHAGAALPLPQRRWQAWSTQTAAPFRKATREAGT